MARREFSNPTKRAAWERANGICQAIGPEYGLPEGVRCTWDLRRGVEYDHDDPDANSKDNSLENCKCLCPRCHDFKTRFRDRPLITKTDHQEDMVRGIRENRNPMPCGRNSKFKKKMNGQVVARCRS